MDSFTNQDFDNHNENYRHYSTKSGKTENVFALFSRSLGIFSIFCAIFSVFFLSLLCGGLAIVLALLSKGYETKMIRSAKAGFICGLLGVTIQISSLVMAVYNIIYVPEYREQFNYLYEEMYGTPADDTINEMLDQLANPNEGGTIL